MDFQTYYAKLIKPSWAPSPDVIGLIWSILYPIIIGVNAIVIYMLTKGKITWLVALPFWLNLAFNLAFTPVQFGLRNQLLAAIVVVLIWLTIIWAMVAIWPHNKWLAIAYIPYLTWVTIAGVLQLSITAANR
jgi:tryptophan-rich sensory protein